jgi:Uma2 family endonuclease
MTTTARLMTIEEFRKLPEEQVRRHELRHGELVQVNPPRNKHYKIQNRITDLLRGAAGESGFVGIELAFRPLPEHEFREADVAFVSKERWDKIDPDDDSLAGAPELVVEVLSPSNTVAEINDKEKLCLENGCSEFWVVDADLKQVKVSTPDGITTTYKYGQEILLKLFGNRYLRVNSIFA